MNRELRLLIATAVAKNSGDGCAKLDFENCPPDNLGPCFCLKAADDIAAALEAAGVASVPVEMTEEMSRISNYPGTGLSSTEIKQIWAAALNASPYRVKKEG